MTQHCDFFGQPLTINDRVLVAAVAYPQYFRVANIIRFTEKAIVISRAGMTEGKKPLYAKPDEVIRMTDELEMLYTVRLLTK
jgi:hypothetical protein